MPTEHPSLFQTPSQIALPLEKRAGRGVQRLVVGSANAQAIEALGNPASWPFHVAVLTGPPRSGKSLIGCWLSGQNHAMPLDVIDDAHLMDETALFHRWNAVQQGGARAGEALLMIAARGEGGWKIALPDLASRIGGSLQLSLSEPDDAMAAELLIAMAEERGLALAPGAADYLVPRTERSHAALEALIATIDRISLERQSPATMSVWRAALEALQGPEQQRLF